MPVNFLTEYLDEVDQVALVDNRLEFSKPNKNYSLVTETLLMAKSTLIQNEEHVSESSIASDKTINQTKLWNNVLLIFDM